MKIGVFGGTFDPVHQGHIELCKTAIRELSLDLLYVIPNGNPPHKDRETDKLDRLKMVEIAFFGMPKVTVSDYEIKKNAECYTVETLSYLKEKHPEDEIFFLMGMENINQFFHWREPKTICRLAKLVFFGRNGVGLTD